MEDQRVGPGLRQCIRDRFGHRLVLHALSQIEPRRDRGRQRVVRRRRRATARAVRAHLVHEARAIGIVGTDDFPRRVRALGRRQAVERGQANASHRRRQRAGDVGRDHRPAVRFRQFHERVIVRHVGGPGTRAREKILVADCASEILIYHRLNVPLEHFQREDDMTVALAERPEERQLDPVRRGIVVFLAEEDHLGGVRRRGHAIEPHPSPASHVERTVLGSRYRRGGWGRGSRRAGRARFQCDRRHQESCYGRMLHDGSWVHSHRFGGMFGRRPGRTGRSPSSLA